MTNSEPIRIVARPEVVNPPDRLGSALDIPLSRAPEPDWMQLFVRFLDLEKLGVPRLEIADGRLRFWMTDRARGQLSTLLDSADVALRRANEALIETVRNREAGTRAASDRIATEKAKAEETLDRWWQEHAAAEA